jgi:phosphoenolpyruvate carboxykinase (ATP)
MCNKQIVIRVVKQFAACINPQLLQIFTGRSPRDKYIVRDEQTRDTVWWADSGLGRNDKRTPRRVSGLAPHQASMMYSFLPLSWPATRLFRLAWQAHFVKNMFIVPSADELASFTPDFVVLNGAGQGGCPGWRRTRRR